MLKLKIKFLAREAIRIPRAIAKRIIRDCRKYNFNENFDAWIDCQILEVLFEIDERLDHWDDA